VATSTLDDFKDDKGRDGVGGMLLMSEVVS
jgi:hypothetical protein